MAKKKRRVAKKVAKKKTKKKVAKKKVAKKKSKKKRCKCVAKTAAGKRCKSFSAGRSKFCASHKGKRNVKQNPGGINLVGKTLTADDVIDRNFRLF